MLMPSARPNAVSIIMIVISCTLGTGSGSYVCLDCFIVLLYSVGVCCQVAKKNPRTALRLCWGSRDLHVCKDVFAYMHIILLEAYRIRRRHIGILSMFGNYLDLYVFLIVCSICL